MTEIERALACFNEGFSCAQAVLSTYAPRFGLDREMALRIAGAFGGGMGRLGEVCGAVTGAFMLIGLKYGKIRAEDDQARETAYALVREFADRFTSRNGSIRCKELLGYDISTPEGLALAREREVFTTVCPKLVRDAAEIIGQMLATADAGGG
ncbi:MAG: C_GCAxxG_C_C family protein [Chloroflexi bacterium]|nr:C_GCAxxG_C_C family protein [Chloroflexota bacterium]